MRCQAKHLGKNIRKKKIKKKKKKKKKKVVICTAISCELKLMK